MRVSWWLAVGVVVASNAAAVGSAAWNRRGAPEAVLELTERELALPPASADSTALALRLAWIDPARTARGRAPAAESDTWFDLSKLEEIGFDCSLPLDEANLERLRMQPPRSTYVVLEYDGEAWRAMKDEVMERSSRLVAVDAGNDPAALRRRWPDRRRAVVVSGTANLLVDRRPDGNYFLHGRIGAVYPAELNVPRPFNQVLAPLQTTAGRYRVRVAWGRKAAWIEAVSVPGKED